MEEEWHQKYAFLIQLLRKPHAVLVKESLSRERGKLGDKLAAYRLEKSLVRDSLKSHLQGYVNFIAILAIKIPAILPIPNLPPIQNYNLTSSHLLESF